MNFKEGLLTKVLVGEKTQTRRPVKQGHILIAGLRSAVDCKGRTVYEVGKDYAACPGRGKKQLGRIEIVRIRCEDVRCISAADVLAEGFASEYEFFRVWCGFYDPKALINPNASSNQIVMDTADALGNFGANQYLSDWKHIRLLQRPHELYQAWVLDFKLVI